MNQVYVRIASEIHKETAVPKIGDKDEKEQRSWKHAT